MMVPPQTPPFPWDIAVVRASALFVIILVLLAILVLLNVWRIERRTGTAMSAVAMVTLATALLLVGTIFMKCTWTGCYPNPLKEFRR